MQYKIDYKFASIIFCLSLMILFIVYPYFYMSSHTILMADDFYHWIQINNNIDTSKNWLLVSFSYGIWDCLHYGGRYFTMMLQSLFSPRVGIDIVRNLHCFMVINTFLYFASLMFFVYSVFEYIIFCKSDISLKIKTIIMLLTYILVIYVNAGYNFHLEIFSWYSAATAYPIPLSLVFISLSLLLINIKYKNGILLLLQSLISFLSMGGNVCIVVSTLFFTTFLFIYLLILKRINLYTFMSLIQYYIFGFVNIGSLGNYLRVYYKTSEDYISITRTLNLTMKAIHERMDLFMGKPFLVIFVIIMCIIIALLMFKRVEINIHHLLISIVLQIMTIFSLIPVYMGYSDKIIAYDRVFYVFDLLMIFTLVYTIIICILFIRKLFYNFIENIYIKLLGIMALSICILFSSILFFSRNEINFEKIDVLNMYDDINSGRYKKLSDGFRKNMQILEKNREKDSCVIDDLSHYDLPKMLNMYFNEINSYRMFFGIKNITLSH